MRSLLAIVIVGLLASAVSAATSTPRVVADSELNAGGYIVMTAGCNHCHTQGWEASNGTVPQSAWLKGGEAPPNIPTPNLRVVLHAMPRATFVHLFREKQPPSAMPWYDLDNFSDADLDAVYDFVNSLK